MARTDRDMKIKERVEKMTLKRREEIANRLALEFYPELDRDHDFFRFKPRNVCPHTQETKYLQPT